MQKNYSKNKSFNIAYQTEFADSITHFLFFSNSFYLFGCTQSLLQHVGSDSLTRDGTQAPCNWEHEVVLASGPPRKYSLFTFSRSCLFCLLVLEFSHCKMSSSSSHFICNAVYFIQLPFYLAHTDLKSKWPWPLYNNLPNLIQCL